MITFILAFHNNRRTWNWVESQLLIDCSSHTTN